MIFSFTTEPGDKIAFGIKNIPLLEYEPFSFTDFAINILVGGIATLLGLFSSLLKSLL